MMGIAAIQLIHMKSTEKYLDFINRVKDCIFGL
jgi:hypothetical protein